MTKVFLIRHGETEWNVKGKYLGLTDLPLTEKGETQAKALAKYLEDEPISFLYCSNLERAKSTAKAVAEAKGLEIIIKPGLNEVDFGEWEGLTYTEIKAKYGNLIDDWLNNTPKVAIPEGESWSLFESRVVKTFSSIVSRNNGQTVAVVTHGGVIKVILSRVLGIEASFFKIRQDKGALNIVEFFDDGTAAITLMNSTCYQRIYNI
ncbi:MAG: alpha-ribazole phosphatase [Candidatus Subteraquimicrobiales bacterium]|nr:alpha-ribazole phosphatase [Candidatus Subteraquimicrobiales bacterium]